MKKIKFINIVLVMCLLISCMAHSGIYAAVPETPDSTMAILPPLTLQYVTLSKSSATLSLGEGMLLTATLGPAASSNEISWYSSNTNVARVINGFVSAISPGTAIITVSYDGPISQSGTTTDTCTVVVTENRLFEDGTYFFENAATKNYANASNITNVNTQALSGDDGVKWNIEFDPTDSFYTIRSVETEYYLYAPTSNTAMMQTSYSITAYNRFRFMKTGADTYAIVPFNRESTPAVIALPSVTSGVGINLICSPYTSGANQNDEWKIHRMLPTSGSELEFGMPEWTEPFNPVVRQNNCYSYAINNQTTRSGIVWRNQDPGKYAGYEIDGYDIDPLNNNKLETALFLDFIEYMVANGTSLIYQEIGQYEACPEGSYKIALVVDPYLGGDDGSDYHWYRQDSDGLWSHKRGYTLPTRYDAGDKLIIDPQYADRDYESSGNYSIFIGYYAITPWNNYYNSSSEYLSIDEEVVYTTNTALVNYDIFNLIEVGMTIDEVIRAVGSTGVIIGSGRVTSVYSCTNGESVKIQYTYDINLETYIVYRVAKGGVK